MGTKLMLHRSALAAAALVALGSYSAVNSAAELKTVRTQCDEAVAARTNMKCTAADAGTLKVTYDKAVAERTNMPPRDSDAPQAVTVTQDQAVLERTNVGGIANQPKPATKDSVAGSR